MGKKYYWLKLKKDFFKRHDIRIIESMPNGKDYILFYLKLLVESLGHDGNLRFSDTIPYNEQMLATITNTNVDTVKSAMKVFSQLNMIDVLDDQTIYMAEVNEMIGEETEWAKKKRIYREAKGQIEDSSGTIKDNVRQEKELEKELEKDNKKHCENECTEKVSKAHVDNFFESVWKLYPNKRGKGQVSDSKKRQLLDIGFDELSRAIDRYKADLEKETWRKSQNGSTFFNSGYIDYLDNTYKPPAVQKPKQNKFNNFEPREQDFTEIEKALLG